MLSATTVPGVEESDATEHLSTQHRLGGKLVCFYWSQTGFICDNTERKDKWQDFLMFQFVDFFTLNIVQIFSCCCTSIRGVKTSQQVPFSSVMTFHQWGSLSLSFPVLQSVGHSSQPIQFCYLPLPTLFQTSPSYFVIHLHLNRPSALCEKYYYLHLADKETMDQQS